MALPDGCLGVIRVPSGCSRLADNDVHLLPCCINYNGPAPVSDYFRPHTAESFIEGVEVKEAAFRGRKLLGRTTELPQDYYGLLLEKEISGGDCKNTNKLTDNVAPVDIWNAKVIFQDVTYWRHDNNPHSIDIGGKTLEWLRLASVMHKPVSEAEVMLLAQNGMCKENGHSGQKRKLEQT